MAPTARAVSLHAFREGAVALVPDLSCRLFGENDLDLTGIGQYPGNLRDSNIRCAAGSFGNVSELACMAAR